MAGPWEAYQQQGAPADQAPLRITVRPQDAAGPWQAYASQPAASEQPAPTAPSMLESIHQTVSDVTTGLGQGATFGFADELVAAGLTPIELGIGLVTGSDEGKGIGSRISDSYGRAIGKVRADVKQAKERSPVASTIGEIGGGVLSAGGLAKQGVTLLNPATQGYRQMIGRGAAEGAAYGGVHGAGTGEGVEGRVDQAAKGAAIGAGAGGVFGAAGARIANKAAARSAPTLDELRTATNLAYKEAENANVIIRPDRYQAVVDRLFTRLANEGVDPTLHPGVMAAFKRLEDLKGAPVPFQTLDILRRVANGAGKNIANPDERRLARLMVEEIDDLMGNLKPSDVMTGDGAMAGEMIRAGRQLWSRVRKSEALENVIERATNRVGANYTAAGFQTAVRQEIKSILNNPRKLRGFSKEEVSMMKGIARGGSTENLLRMVGKFAPRGVVSGGLMGAATASNPVLGLTAWGASEAARSASAAITKKKLSTLVEAVRRGGPRVLNALSAKQRSILDSAIAGGEITLEQLGLPARPREVVAR